MLRSERRQRVRVKNSAVLTFACGIKGWATVPTMTADCRFRCERAPRGPSSGFQHESDARRLELHAENTRLLRFGKLAARQRKERGENKPETFDFVGFTHICRKSRAGRFVLFRHTSRTRMQRRLRALREELMQRRHLPIPKQGKWIRQVGPLLRRNRRR